MLIATCAVGDAVVTLTVVQPIPSKMIRDMQYRLTFHDQVEPAKNCTLVYTTENEALQAFAAWIAADEPNGHWFNKAIVRLRSTPGMELHMP